MKARDVLNIYSTIADLKEIDYRNTLALAALVRLLEKKGIITSDEFSVAASHLDSEACNSVIPHEKESTPGSILP